MIKGSQSIQFENAPFIISSGSIVGKKEADGPLGALFDRMDETSLFGENTWEAAESKMQKEACLIALGKANMQPNKVRYLYGGDLLRQGIATSMGIRGACFENKLFLFVGIFLLGRAYCFYRGQESHKRNRKWEQK